MIFRDSEVDYDENANNQSSDSDESYQTMKKLFNLSKTLPFSEEKNEVSINRITSQSAGLRKIERVLAGVIFKLDIIFRIFDEDEKTTVESTDESGENKAVTLREYLYNELLNAKNLLKQDCLGGSGSRGYGRIKFSDWDDKNIKKYIKIGETANVQP